MKVFISHARRITSWQKGSQASLFRRGLTFGPTRKFIRATIAQKMIGQALEESDAMVAIVTRNAIENGPLIDDIQFALTSKNYGGRVIPILVGLISFEPGKEVPWILLRLNPIYLESSDSDLHEAIERVRLLVEKTPHAAS